MSEENLFSPKVEKKLTLPATIENLDSVLAFLEENLEEMGASMKTQNQMAISLEEIYVNVAHYAYPSGDGEATICFEADDEWFVLKVIDSGTPFNPLQKEDPDVTLDAEKREIGGLGIFMTKKLMDEVSYDYSSGKNILTMKKRRA